MKISHGLEFIAFWMLTKAVQLMPGWLADKIAAGLGLLGYRILTSRRIIAMDNLKRAFHGEKTQSELEHITREAFKNVVREIIEFARTPIVCGEKLNRFVYRIDGLDHIHNVLEEGKGLVLVTGHIGNGEYLGGWLAQQDYPIDFLVGKQHNKLVDDMFNDFRRSYGAELIPIGVAARHAIKSLRSNRMIILMSDQHSATGGTIVEFFERPASTPKGPANFAVKLGSPVIFAALLREKYNRFRALFYPPIYPQETDDAEKEITRITQEYTSQLEQLIRTCPEQWMWTHRRWKVD